MKVNTCLFAVLVLLMAFFLTGCSNGPVPYRQESTSPQQAVTGIDQSIKTGDSVRVSVYGHEDMSGDFEVDSNGNIAMPLIRQVKAAGLSTSELEAEVVRLLKPDYLRNPIVSVELLNQSPIYVTGEVRQPGQFPYRSNMTVFAAAALAGGYTYRAKSNVAYIIRAGDKSRSKQTVTPETLIYPGDIIEIPERLF